MKRRWALIAFPIALGLALEPLPAGAADPPSGTIDAKNKVVEWTGTMDIVGLNPTNGDLGDEPTCGPLPAVLLSCDVFELTVNIPETGYTASGGVNVSTSCAGTGPLADYDLFVYDEGGTLVGSSTSPACNEAVIIPRASGVYMVQVNPWSVVNDQYFGVAEAFGLAKPKPKPKPKKKKK
jgi:hypothetical protein